jgi:hypothetical protein
MLATALIGLLLIPLLQQDSSGGEPRPMDLALTNVTVVRVTDGVRLPDRTILIRSDRIAAVGPTRSTAVPAGAREVDGSGRYVIPGLWDAHVHSAGNAAWHFPLFVAHGVTSVRNMHTGVDTALQLVRAIKRRLASGELLGPRFIANGAIVDGEPSVWEGTVLARTPAEGRAVVDSLERGGADFIKVYNNLLPEAYLAIAAEARRIGIPMDGHVPPLVSPPEAAAAGQRTSEHLFGMRLGCSAAADSIRRAYGRQLTRGGQGEAGFFAMLAAAGSSRSEPACTRTVEAYRHHGLAVVPTMVSHPALLDPGAVVRDTGLMRLLPGPVRGQWAAMAASEPPMGAGQPPSPAQALADLRLLHAARVPILAGTDVGNPFLVPGESLHDELELLVQGGLPALDALRAATVVPARVLGLGDSLGAIETGMLADLVLLESDPLEDIRHVRRVAAVVLGGRYLDRYGLDRLVEHTPTSALEAGRESEGLRGGGNR